MSSGNILKKYHGAFSYFIRGGSGNFSRKGGGGGLPGKFRKVPLYFLVLSFVEEVIGR